MGGQALHLKPGRLFGLYVLGYSLGRLWIEFIRVDFASELAGVRVNIWVMLALIIGSVAYLFWGRGDDGEPESDGSVPEEPEASEAVPEEPESDEAVPEEPENISLET